MLHNGPHCRPKKRAAPARGRGTCGGVMSHGLFSGYGERSSGYNYRTALPGLVGPTAVVPDHRVRQRGSGSRPGRAWSGAADRWPDLGVPVIASPGAVAVAGQPAWLPAPQPVPSQGELSVTKPEMAHGMSVINFQSVLACSHHPGTVPAARRGRQPLSPIGAHSSAAPAPSRRRAAPAQARAHAPASPAPPPWVRRNTRWIAT